MNDITLQLAADVNTRKLIGRDGGSLELPAFVLGDQYRCELRLYERTEGRLTERKPHVRTLRASIGNVMMPPVMGAFRVKLIEEGSPAELAPESENIPHHATAGDLRQALTAIMPDISEARAAAPGCWLFRTEEGRRLEMLPSFNSLEPASFVRFRAFQRGDIWWHELSLIQTPLVFTGAHDRVLPEAPSVKRIAAGGSGSEEVVINEIQEVFLPSAFLLNDGGYVIKHEIRQTRVLGKDDGPKQIAAALNAMWKDGVERFKVSLPLSDRPHIEFVGELENQGWPLLEVEVKAHGTGVLTFHLDFSTAELAAALRSAPKIEVPLEIELELIPEGDDPEGPEVSGVICTIAQHTITIVREGIHAELATLTPIDWSRPLSIRSYDPFAPGQIITGSQHYWGFFGDGILRSFSLPHELGTLALHVSVREAAAGGRVLVNGVHYTLRGGVDPENELVLDIVDGELTPGLNSIVVTITTAGPRSAFVQHQHEMAEIIGLNDALSVIRSRLSTLEDILPTTGAGARKDDKTEALTITIPSYEETLFVDPSQDELPSIGRYLLPAIHQAEPYTALPDPLPLPSSVSLKVFEHTGLEPLKIKIGGGVVDRRFPSIVQPGGYVASDGRSLYPVTRAPETNSFYAPIFDRDLFWFPISDRQHRVGRVMELEFSLLLQMLLATSAASWVLELRMGTAPQDTEPSPVGLNLQNVIWAPTPIIQRRLLVNELEIKHQFGVRIGRSVSGMSMDVSEYGVWEGHNAAAPASASYLLQARLIQFDTENNKLHARGLPRYQIAGKDGDEITVTIK